MMYEHVPTPELLKLLEERRAEAVANPGSGIPVEEAHARIRKALMKRRENSN